MKKKIISLIGALFLGVLLWYLFIKPYDYLVSFKAKTFPGAINQSIKTWNKSLENRGVIDQVDINNLTQQITFNDSIFSYKWKINSINDSTSNVKIYIKNIDHSLKNKIMIPFSNTDFEKRTKSTLVGFTEKLNEHIKKFKVDIKGESEIRSTYCAYVPIKTDQLGKAKGMMDNYSLLSTHIAKNEIELNGLPFIEVMSWDMVNDSIYYNFCYPIIEKDSLAPHKLISYKQVDSKKALKAIYNGNYITSDRAWYALIDYADKRKIQIDFKPFEIFHNNPGLSGDELNWKAEVYLPIK